MYNFLGQTVQIFILYITLRKINTSLSRGIDEFWSGGIETFWAKKSHKKNC